MLRHMRTTFRLPDALYDDVRQVASSEGATVTSIVEQALRAEIDRRRAPQVSDYTIEPFTPEVAGTQAGVDLHDAAALLDLMDGLR